jgi:LysM repeat protein
MNGAATNPDFNVVARAGGQVKLALDATIALGGENYVFWGGREGYMSLLNTDMGRELDHMGQFLRMARDYARAQGFKGNFFIEPKPMEPMKHQYDFDCATAIGFLRAQGLENDFKMNIEVNQEVKDSSALGYQYKVIVKDTKEEKSYTIKSGDNLNKISKNLGVTIIDLKKWNDLKNNVISAGEKLKYYTNKIELPNAMLTRPDFEIYTVQKGDTLFIISKKHPGITVEDLKKWNSISDDAIQPGMKLKINE